MKILQVVDKLNIGGAERVVVDMSNILYENGTDVSVLSLLDDGALCGEINREIRQYILRRNGRFSIKTMRNFVDIANGYDVLHVHMRHNLRYVVLCKMLFGLKSKVVFQDHTGDVHLDIPTKFCLSEIDAYVAVCKRNADNFVAKGITNAINVFVLPNIIVYRDSEAITVGEVEKMVMVGNIREEKNYLFGFNIIGDKSVDIYGNYSSVNYKERFLERLRCGCNVKVIEGESNVQQYLYKYKMGLHVSPSETGPLVLIEYLAHGLPFLTYNTGEVVNQIGDELPEFIVDSFDERLWKRRIEELSELIDERGDELRDRMRVVFNKYYSEKTYFEKCKEIYMHVLSC